MDWIKFSFLVLQVFSLLILFIGIKIKYIDKSDEKSYIIRIFIVFIIITAAKYYYIYNENEYEQGIIEVTTHYEPQYENEALKIFNDKEQNLKIITDIEQLVTKIEDNFKVEINYTYSGVDGQFIYKHMININVTANDYLTESEMQNIIKELMPFYETYNNSIDINLTVYNTNKNITYDIYGNVAREKYEFYKADLKNIFDANNYSKIDIDSFKFESPKYAGEYILK